MKIRAFITHKKAETYKDCQDRFCINPETKSLAVSDGVSQSIFPGIWANMLVYEYANKNWCPNHESAKELAVEWRRQINVILEAKKQKGENTRNLENALAIGKAAGATIVGLRFKDDSHWCCDVLGDSCLIQINNDNSIIAIHSSQSGEFDSHPDYFDSNEKVSGRGEPNTKEGEFGKGEKLLLVSDPFSDFLFKAKKNKEDIDYIEELLKVDNHDSFCLLVDDFRDKGMHNDDSTLIIIEYDGNDEFDVCFQDDIVKLQKEQENILVGGNSEVQECGTTTINCTNVEEPGKNITWKDVCLFLETHIEDILSKFSKKRKNRDKVREIIKRIIDIFKQR
jgi:serine/threonine protein phosphatase PrpC